MSAPLRLELWHKAEGEEISSYTHMVWSVEDDRPYWFRDERRARIYMRLRQRGNEGRAEQIAEVVA